MAKNPNPKLPSDPRVTDYENALFMVDELGPPLNDAIIAVVPAADGLARYVYDYSKLVDVYAEFREADMDDEDDEEGITETVLNLPWGSPTEGTEPLLATDPEVETGGMDVEGDDPVVVMVQEKEYWLVR